MRTPARVTVIGDKAMLADMKSLGAIGTMIGKTVIGRIVTRAAVRARALAPVDDEDGGQLRDSVRATKPGATKRGVISAAVVAGGKPLEAHLGKRKSNAYAIVQHDDLTLSHNDGQAKYVETPALQEFPRLPEELRGELDRSLAKGGS